MKPHTRLPLEHSPSSLVMVEPLTLLETIAHLILLPLRVEEKAEGMNPQAVETDHVEEELLGFQQKEHQEQEVMVATEGMEIPIVLPIRVQVVEVAQALMVKQPPILLMEEQEAMEQLTQFQVLR